MIPIRGLRAPVPERREEPVAPSYRRCGDGKRTPRFFWAPDHDDELRRLWESGLPSSQIADELGDRFSKNSVIGRAHRIGLKRRANPVGTQA